MSQQRHLRNDFPPNLNICRKYALFDLVCSLLHPPLQTLSDVLVAYTQWISEIGIRLCVRKFIARARAIYARCQALREMVAEKRGGSNDAMKAGLWKPGHEIAAISPLIGMV